MNNTLSYMGRGVKFFASLTANRLNERGWNFVTFLIYMLRRDWTKKISIFLGGWYSQFSPLKEGRTKKLPPITAYDANFFMIESFSTIETEMFARNQTFIPQELTELWPF